MPHNERLTPKPAQRITIPNVDFRQFNRDPIGAGINTLIQTLAIGANRFERKRVVKEAEDFKQAEVIFSAVEARGEEISEQELLGKLRPIFGDNIYAQGKGLQRRVQGTMGRIRGANVSQELRSRIIGREFETVADFDAAYDELANKVGASHEENGSFVAGWFETTASALREGRATVLQLDNDRKMSQARGAISQEIELGFEAMASSSDPHAQVEFAEVLAGGNAEMELMAPGDALRRQEVLLETFERVALREENFEFIDEFADELKPYITDTDMKNSMETLILQAENRHEARIGKLTLEQREAMQPFQNQLTEALLAKNQKKVDEAIAKMREIGGPQAVGPIAAILSLAASFERNRDIGGGGVDDSVFETLLVMRAHGDAAGSRDVVLQNSAAFAGDDTNRAKGFAVLAWADEQEDQDRLQQQSTNFARIDDLTDDEVWKDDAKVIWMQKVDAAGPDVTLQDKARFVTEAVKESNENLTRVNLSNEILNGDLDPRNPVEARSLVELREREMTLPLQRQENKSGQLERQRLRMRKRQLSTTEILQRTIPGGGLTTFLIGERSQESQDFSAIQAELEDLDEKAVDAQIKLDRAERVERRLLDDAANGMTFEDRVINVFYHSTAEALADQ